MSRQLELILDDLRVGLRQRAARRRRTARAATATVTTSATIALVLALAGPLIHPRAPAYAGDGTVTARLLAGDSCADGIGCLPAPQLNLPKQPQE